MLRRCRADTRERPSTPEMSSLLCSEDLLMPTNLLFTLQRNQFGLIVRAPTQNHIENRFQQSPKQRDKITSHAPAPSQHTRDSGFTIVAPVAPARAPAGADLALRPIRRRGAARRQCVNACGNRGLHFRHATPRKQAQRNKYLNATKTRLVPPPANSSAR